MGQAKERKLRDPNYGKPRHRGIVISPKVRADTGGRFEITGGLHPQELRFSLLFWDELVWPDGVVACGKTPEEEFLISSGVLSRPEYYLDGVLNQIYPEMQFQAYSEREEAEPGVWSISQGPNSLLLTGDYLEADKGASIQLIRSVPIPAEDVPLQEILEFKYRRSDELLHFRAHIELLSSGISASPDSEDELQKHIANIRTVCSDLEAVGRDWQFPMRLSNFNASINFKPSLVSKVVGAWEGAENFGLEGQVLAAAAVGLNSLVEIKTDFAIRSPRVPRSPYKYAYHIGNELI